MSIPSRDLQPELMDSPELTAEEAERALLDLERVNRWSLGSLPVARALLPRLDGDRKTHRVLDLGTGSGQIPADLRRAAGKRGCSLEVVGVDRKLGHLLCGRRRGHPQQRVVAEAAALPFASGVFDWALSTLFFHHFDADTNRRILAEMRRVARRGTLVVDLRRSRLGAWLLRPLFRLLGTGPVARHDGLLSFAQAWSRLEVEELVAGETITEHRRRFPFRFSLLLPGGGKPRRVER
jgi:ubiquinone/menaquinone biosynthesis C-methylase UbiE